VAIEGLEQGQQGLTPSKQEELVLSINVPAIEDIARGLDELNPPAEDAEELQAISDAFAKAAEKIKDDPQGTFQDPYRRASGLAGAFGFVECMKF
jgi:hypothetical protein